VTALTRPRYGLMRAEGGVSRLADDLPEVTGLDLSPVMVWPERVSVVVAAPVDALLHVAVMVFPYSAFRESGGP
jgi:hypothetical protein